MRSRPFGSGRKGRVRCCCFGRCSIAVFIIIIYGMIRVPVDRTIIFFEAWMSLLLAGLFGGFGDLARASLLLGDGLDDTDGDRLPHVTDGEATERRVVGESLDRHGLGGSHFHDGRVTVLDRFGEGFQLFAGTTIAFLEDLFEFAGDVSGVAIHDRRISILNFSWVVENDDLGIEVLALLSWIVLGVGCNIATTDFFDGDVLNVKTNVVTRKSLRKRLVVHLHGFDLSGDISRGERDDHTGLDDSSLHTTNGHRSNAADLVYVLEGKTKWFVGGALRGHDSVQSVNEGESS